MHVRRVWRDSVGNALWGTEALADGGHGPGARVLRGRKGSRLAAVRVLKGASGATSASIHELPRKGYLLGNWVDGRSWPGLVIVLGLNFYISNVMHD